MRNWFNWEGWIFFPVEKWSNNKRLVLSLKQFCTNYWNIIHRNGLSLSWKGRSDIDWSPEQVTLFIEVRNTFFYNNSEFPSENIWRTAKNEDEDHRVEDGWGEEENAQLPSDLIPRSTGDNQGRQHETDSDAELQTHFSRSFSYKPKFTVVFFCE